MTIEKIRGPRHTKAEKEREKFARIYHSEARVRWIQALPSVVSGKGPCANAHTRGDGMSRKAGYVWIVPLTESEHAELHRIGKASFEAAHHIDLDHEASITDARWEVYTAQHKEGTK